MILIMQSTQMLLPRRNESPSHRTDSIDKNPLFRSNVCRPERMKDRNSVPATGTSSTSERDVPSIDPRRRRKNTRRQALRG